MGALTATVGNRPLTPLNCLQRAYCVLTVCSFPHHEQLHHNLRRCRPAGVDRLQRAHEPRLLRGGLGNPLVVEMSDFFTQDEIFQQRRTARIGSQGVLIVGDSHTLICGQDYAVFHGALVGLTTESE